MRLEVVMPVVCTLLVTACLGGGRPLPPAHSVVESLVFRTSLSAFMAEVRSDRHDPRLDWSSDGCSAPVVGGTGRSFDFTDACTRHDFAYRNLSRIDDGRRWSASVRARVDAVFRRDMNDACARRRIGERTSCRTWAAIFHRAVRTWAGP